MTDKPALPASGGSYTVDSTGALVQTVAPTADHPQGNRPRPTEIGDASDVDAAPIEAAASKPKKGAK